MSIATNTKREAHGGTFLLVLGFCAGIFLFVWLQVDPRLLYHGDMATITGDWWVVFPPFFLGREFWQEHLWAPGGMVSYVAKLLLQYYYYPAVGALIVAALAGALVWSASVWGAALGLAGRRIWAFLPALVWLGVVSSYLLHVDDFLASVVALAATAIYGRLVGAKDSVLGPTALYLLLSVPLYWIIGGGYLLFAGGCAALEWRRRGRWLLALCYGGYALVVVVGETWVHRLLQPDEGFRWTVRELMVNTLSAMVPGFWGLLLLGLVLVGDYLLRRWASRWPEVSEGSERVRRAVAGIALLAGLTVITGFGLLDQEARAQLRRNYFGRTGQWQELLADVTAAPPDAYAPSLLYDINRALFETGQLGDRMFEFPQDPKFLVQVGEAAVPHRGCCELLLRLGCINEAERTSYEALEVRGPRPYLLRDLVTINLVKDRPAAARVFLHLLARDVIHRSWARQQLQQLDQDGQLQGSQEVQEIRQRMMRDDRIITSSGELLTVIAQQNPQDRAAFEYLTAYYLLTYRLEQVVQQIPKLRDLGYDHLPASYAEALLLYCQSTGQAPDVGGWTVSADALDRLRTFLSVTQDRNRNFAMLDRLLGGSYYVYFATHPQNAHETSTP